MADSIRESVIRQLELEGELTHLNTPSETVESLLRAASVTRSGILEKARECVCGGREADYGIPEDNFALIADFWDLYLNSCDHDSREIYAHDVANMMILLKVARNATGSKLDNWIDICGYAACGGEIEFG